MLAMKPICMPMRIGGTSTSQKRSSRSVATTVNTIRMTTPIAAFVGGIITTLVVWNLSRRNGRVDTVTLILVGIALNSMIGAGMGILNYVADDEQLRSVVFWSMGSLGGATWRSNLAILPLIALGLIVLPRKARDLNLLVLGEREARVRSGA